MLKIAIAGLHDYKSNLFVSTPSIFHHMLFANVFCDKP